MGTPIDFTTLTPLTEENIDSLSQQAIWALNGMIENKITQAIDRTSINSADGPTVFVEAYTDSNGRNNSVDTGNTPATFDTDKYASLAPVDSGPYVIIRGTGLTPSNFEINNCNTSGNESIVIVSCDTGTDEVKRAQIYKTLFYGTNGSDAKILTATTTTSLETSVTRDVGKQAHYAQISGSQNSGPSRTGQYTGTFVNTSTNDDCSTWSYLATTGNASDTSTGTWELPASTTLNSAGKTTSDETGTDLSADELNNPVTCELQWTETSNFGTSTCTARAFILCEGDITWVETDPNSIISVSNIDFLTDNSIPAMTAIATLTTEITHTIPSGTFPSNISTAFGGFIAEDWETGADVQFKLTGTAGAEDSGWLNTKEKNTAFTAFTSEPTTLIVKLIPKGTSPTAGFPSLLGFGVTAR